MTGAVVLDASAALRCLLREQPGHEAAFTALSTLFEAGFEAVAPDLYPHELGNVLTRITAGPKERAALLQTGLQPARVVPSSETLLRAALERAAANRVSFYDAAHVALAEAENGPLWTEDHELLRKFPHVTVDTAAALAHAARHRP